MFLRDVIDGLLELAVVPSFTRAGIAVRRRLFAWNEAAPQALAGRTVLVTGATGGLGAAMVRAFAALGAGVVLLGRDEAKLARFRSELEREFAEGRFSTLVADLSDRGSIAEAAAKIAATEPALDIVVDNAGAIRPERSRSADGTESSMALMAVGPFALVTHLLPLLARSEDPRIIAVTSGGQYTQPLDVDDLDGERVAYNGARFYARAKRAQVGLMREWARRFGPDGPVVNAMHPGWAATPGLAESLPTFSRVLGPLLRTPEEGIDTIVWLATAPRSEIGSGWLYLDRRRRPFDRVAWTRLSAAERRRLWATVVARAGVEDPLPQP
ncbi:MAG TPA: SDR family NAD(P)-dependent oxidoreductase [Candidatus Limnocylindrales bacterium]|nr:SDR family NAD(P)-dependent oxidoreductase [Candidatus Limnocylindrales bacterium]